MSTYLELDAVNQSSLKHILVSPSHCYHAMTSDREVTEALLTGTALHTAVLEPDRFDREYAEWEKVPGKAEAAFVKAQAASDKTLYSSEWDIPRMAQRLRDDPHSGAILANLHGRAEVSIVWDDPLGVRCKARIDGLFPKLGLDVKTIGDEVTARNCTGAAMKWGYPFQAAFCLRGLRILGEGVRKWALVFIEKDTKTRTFPTEVATFWIDGPILEYGEKQVERALKQYRECCKSGKWPGPGAKGTKNMTLPTWAAAEEDMVIREVADGW